MDWHCSRCGKFVRVMVRRPEGNICRGCAYNPRSVRIAKLQAQLMVLGHSEVIAKLAATKVIDEMLAKR